MEAQSDLDGSRIGPESRGERSRFAAALTAAALAHVPLLFALQHAVSRARPVEPPPSAPIAVTLAQPRPPSPPAAAPGSDEARTPAESAPAFDVAVAPPSGSIPAIAFAPSWREPGVVEALPDAIRSALRDRAACAPDPSSDHALVCAASPDVLARLDELGLGSASFLEGELAPQEWKAEWKLGPGVVGVGTTSVSTLSGEEGAVMIYFKIPF